MLVFGTRSRYGNFEIGFALVVSDTQSVSSWACDKMRLCNKIFRVMELFFRELGRKMLCNAYNVIGIFLVTQRVSTHSRRRSVLQVL